MRSGTWRSGGGVGTAAGIAAAAQPNIPAYTFAPHSFGNVGTMQAANHTYYMRVLGGYAAAATGIRLYITTTSGNICVAVYEDAGASPGARLATSGSVASPGTGVRTIALGGSVAIYPGRWISLSADNTTAAFGTIESPGLLSNAMGTGFSYYEASAFPAPASPNPAGASWYAGFILMSA